LQENREKWQNNTFNSTSAAYRKALINCATDTAYLD
jgi:hypothetical protein